MASEGEPREVTEEKFGNQRRDEDHERRERQYPARRRIPKPKQVDDTAFHRPGEDGEIRES